jgi:hypothetical protein
MALLPVGLFLAQLGPEDTRIVVLLSSAFGYGFRFRPSHAAAAADGGLAPRMATSVASAPGREPALEPHHPERTRSIASSSDQHPVVYGLTQFND